MKRTELKNLKRTELKRKTELKRTGWSAIAAYETAPIGERRAVRRRLEEERFAKRPMKRKSKKWQAATFCASCPMCWDWTPAEDVARAHGADFRQIDGHHVLPRRILLQNGLEHVEWDVRNHLALCRYHHARHEAWVERVPRTMLRASHFEFAQQLGLMWLLDREYPDA